MNKWQETVKRVAKHHPGKSLREILPLAKLEYKKMGHSSSSPTKKHKKHHKKHHKKSHAHKKSRRRKGRRGSRRMRGGTGCSNESPSPNDMSTYSDSLHSDSQLSEDSGPVESYNHYDYNKYGTVPQSGGSHCGTHRRRPRRRRRPKRSRRMRGGSSYGEDNSSHTSSGVAPYNE